MSSYTPWPMSIVSTCSRNCRCSASRSGSGPIIQSSSRSGPAMNPSRLMIIESTTLRMTDLLNELSLSRSRPLCVANGSSRGWVARRALGCLEADAGVRAVAERLGLRPAAATQVDVADVDGVVVAVSVDRANRSLHLVGPVLEGLDRG